MFNRIKYSKQSFDCLEYYIVLQGQAKCRPDIDKGVTYRILATHKVKAPIAGRLRKCHSIFCINRSKCDAESRIAAIILIYVSSLL